MSDCELKPEHVVFTCTSLLRAGSVLYTTASGELVPMGGGGDLASTGWEMYLFHHCTPPPPRIFTAEYRS